MSGKLVFQFERNINNMSSILTVCRSIPRGPGFGNYLCHSLSLSPSPSLPPPASTESLVSVVSRSGSLRRRRSSQERPPISHIPVAMRGPCPSPGRRHCVCVSLSSLSVISDRSPATGCVSSRSVSAVDAAAAQRARARAVYSHLARTKVAAGSASLREYTHTHRHTHTHILYYI